MLVVQEPSRDLSGLAKAAQSGSQADVECLLQRVRQVAHRYSRARLAAYPGGVQLADDVTQEICMAGLRALPGYRDRGRPFEAFVHGIASRKVADAQRAAARHPQPTDDLPERADDRPTPEEHAVFWSEVDSALRWLGWLPDHLREVVLLRVAAGLTAEEAGAALGMTAGAVRVAQHRALSRMRQFALQAQEVAVD